MTGKARPIIFRDGSVLRIFDGTKFQTRRVVKPQPLHHWQSLQPMFGVSPDGVPFGDPSLWRVVGPDYPDDESDDRRCPQGQPGDLLWLREAWAEVGFERADLVEPARLVYTDDVQTVVCYRADSPTFRGGMKLSRWSSPIHMPRWASRLLLEITACRAERVREISDQDCLAEGIWPLEHGYVGGLEAPTVVAGVAPMVHPTPQAAFAAGWDELHARPKPVVEHGAVLGYVSFPWDGTCETRTHRGLPWHVHPNPYVWVISFRKVEPAEGA